MEECILNCTGFLFTENRIFEIDSGIWTKNIRISTTTDFAFGRFTTKSVTE